MLPGPLVVSVDVERSPPGIPEDDHRHVAQSFRVCFELAKVLVVDALPVPLHVSTTMLVEAAEHGSKASEALFHYINRAKRWKDAHRTLFPGKFHRHPYWTSQVHTIGGFFMMAPQAPGGASNVHMSADTGGADNAGEALKFFHGTSWRSAQQIQREGFVESADGCLGRGIYVAREEKARRFAEDSARHGGDVGGLVEVLVHVRKVKYVRSNNTTWRGEGFDACRAEQTSASTNMEWCIKSQHQVKIIRITQVPVPGGEPLGPHQLSSIESAWVQDDRERAASHNRLGGQGEPGDEAMLRARLAELDDAAATIETERRMVRVRLADFERSREEERRQQEARARAREEERRRQEALAEALAEEARRAHASWQKELAKAVAAQQKEQEQLHARKKRGRRIEIYLAPGARDIANDIDGDEASCVAMGASGDGTASLVVIHDDGSFAHSAGMPLTVAKEFGGKHRRKQSYVSLGAHGQFFIKRNTGWTQFNGNMDKEFVAQANRVKHVTFGEHFHSWFALLSGGGFVYKGAPNGFEAAKNSNKYSKKTIEDVSWGPRGEWWVAWTDGTWKSGGVGTECEKQLAKLKRGGWGVKKIIFGPNGEWIIRYDK